MIFSCSPQYEYLMRLLFLIIAITSIPFEWMAVTALENQYANLTKPSVAKVKIKKVKAAKKGKKATVTWKKISGAAGYQVTYGTKKSLKKAKTVTVNASKSKAVIRKLKNKKYYVRVRAFKTYRGQTFYGSYSKVKKVTIR